MLSGPRIHFPWWDTSTSRHKHIGAAVEVKKNSQQAEYLKPSPWPFCQSHLCRCRHILCLFQASPNQFCALEQSRVYNKGGPGKQDGPAGPSRAQTYHLSMQLKALAWHGHDSCCMPSGRPYILSGLVQTIASPWPGSRWLCSTAILFGVCGMNPCCRAVTYGQTT